MIEVVVNSVLFPLPQLVMMLKFARLELLELAHLVKVINGRTARESYSLYALLC